MSVTPLDLDKLAQTIVKVKHEKLSHTRILKVDLRSTASVCRISNSLKLLFVKTEGYFFR